MPSAPIGTSAPQKAVRLRLDSWKEIADYLGKGERTAKRWAVERAMPVHHVPGGGHGSVFAFPAELDRWLLQEYPKKATSAADIPRVAKTDDDVATTHSAPQISHAGPPHGKRHGPLRRFVPYGIVTAGLVLAVIYLTNLHTVNAYAPPFLRSLFRSTRSVPVDSDPEKQLAHELYLRGRFEWSRRTPENLNRALDYFTQAVVHDPGNAQAYVGLADTYNLLREYTLMPENEAYERAIAAAKKAIELDDSLAEAHRCLAFDEVFGNWDFETGEREFRRALELNPHDPITHLWFANAFAAPGWYPVTLREIERAEELDPSSRAILADKGFMLYHAGHTKKAFDTLRQVELADPEFLSPHRYLADVYRTLRDYPNFLRENERVAALTRDDVLQRTTAAARAGWERDGERGLWQDLYLAQKEAHAEGKLPGAYLAITCVRLGKKQEALQLLRGDYDKHDPAFLMSRDNFDLLTLRNEPAYQELWSKIRVPSPEGRIGQSATVSNSSN